MYSGITKIYDKKTVGHVFLIFFWGGGYIKDQLFIQQLPYDLTDLKATVKNIDVPTLMRVRQELEYHINVYHVTQGTHIEQL
jgi:hypothetical protein